MRDLALAGVFLAAWPAAAGAEEDVRFVGAVRVRVQDERNFPSTAVRFDPAAGAFALSDYLSPTGGDLFASVLASVGLEGRHLGGDLRWTLTFDTGELRRERAHAIGQVCWSEQTPSGLATPGGTQCDLYRLTPTVWSRVVVPVEETGLEDEARITSNGRSLEDEVDESLLVREAFVRWRFGRAGFASLSAGRKRFAVGNGYVHDDYGLGVQVDLDLGAVGPRWDLSAAAFLPTRDLTLDEDRLSSMFAVRADYLPSLFEHAGVFAAALRERSDSLANVFRGAVEERLVLAALESDPGSLLHRRANQLLAATSSALYRSEGTLFWVGTSGKLSPWAGHRLGWTAALLLGEIDRITVGEEDVPLGERIALRGQLASARWDFDLGRTLAGGVSVLYLSGGELPPSQIDGSGIVPATGTYRAFLGVTPYVTETAIFFGGGLSESYADRQARAPGVNGRGVLAPALSLRWYPSEDLTVRAKAAWLRAVEPGPFGGSIYGTELDLDATWEAADWLVLGIEGDVLFPGDFFPGSLPVTRALLALDVLTP